METKDSSELAMSCYLLFASWLVGWFVIICHLSLYLSPQSLPTDPILQEIGQGEMKHFYAKCSKKASESYVMLD